MSNTYGSNPGGWDARSGNASGSPWGSDPAAPSAGSGSSSNGAWGAQPQQSPQTATPLVPADGPSFRPYSGQPSSYDPPAYRGSASYAAPSSSANSWPPPVSASPYTAAVNQTTQPTASSSSYGNYGYGTSEYSSAQPAAPAHAIAPAHAEPAGKRRGLGVGLVLVCLIVSLASGFGGAKLAAYLEPVEETTPPTVIYQEVENTGVDATTTVSDIVATVEDSVVAITTETVVFSGWMGSAVQEGAGSGVIVSQDGYVVTNYHVINGARAIAVHLADGTDAQARLVGGDQANDLAVLKIESAGLQAAVMGSSSTLVVGQTAIAIGNPLGELGGTVTSGIISALDREITIEGQAMTLIQTDTAINPGNSGGGLFDLNGSLIGVVNAKSSGSDIEGLGFAIPIDDARPIVEQIIATDPGR